MIAAGVRGKLYNFRKGPVGYHILSRQDRHRDPHDGGLIAASVSIEDDLRFETTQN